MRYAQVVVLLCFFQRVYNWHLADLGLRVVVRSCFIPELCSHLSIEYRGSASP